MSKLINRITHYDNIFAIYRKTTTQAIPQNTDTKITFDTEIKSNKITYSSGNFYLPENGLYNITCECFYSVNLSGNRSCWIETDLNPNEKYSYFLRKSNTSPLAFNLSTTLYISAPTNIKLMTYHDSANQTVDFGTTRQDYYIDINIYKLS